MTSGQVTVGTKAPPKKVVTFADLLDYAKPHIASILPKHLTAERALALADLAASKTPRLKECTPLSLFNSIVLASRLGLEIGQHAYLVPYKNHGVYECVFIPDYRGLIALAVRSGKVKHIDARVVYKTDIFDYELGSAPKITHRPNLDGDRSQDQIRAFYMVAHLADGTTVFDEPMSKKEVDAIRARSRAKDDGPWVTDYVAMGKKTVVKRGCKFLPQTPELAAAIEADNRAETGEVGMVSDIIDTSQSLNQRVADQTREKIDDLRERLAEKAVEGAGGEPPDAASTAEPTDAPSPSSPAPAPSALGTPDPGDAPPW